MRENERVEIGQKESEERRKNQSVGDYKRVERL